MELKFDKNYDVIVAGLGTAGAIALIAAAKRGLNVLGIEYFNAMGGTGTLGGIGGYYFGARGGLYTQINKKVNKMENSVYTSSEFPRFDTKIFALESIAIELCADILYEATITNVFAEHNKVLGVRCFKNGKWINIGSKVIIDCTGEATLCHMAGCKTKCGRAFDGQTQPFSNIAIVTNGDVPYGINRDYGYVEQNNCTDYSQKVINSTAFNIVFKNNSDEGTKFLTNASYLGYREGRKIIGEESLTLDGFFSGQKTDEPLFYAYSNIDNHGKDTAFEDETLLDWYVGAGLWGINFSIGIPIGTLIPKGWDGIITAGRSLDTDHNLSACIRMKSDMEKCGEAAAEIAFMSIKDNVRLKDVDYKKLSIILSKTGCLDEANNVGFINRVTPTKLIPFKWHTDENKIIEGLKRENAGIAIWSAKLMGSAKIASVLKNLMTSSDKLLRKNAAIALGLLGDVSACPVLREIVKKRDAYIPKTSIKYTYTHATTAIYLLGKMKDKTSMDILLDVIISEGNFNTEGFVPDELYTTETDVRFQYISFALAALNRIAEAYPECKTRISENIYTTLFNINFTLPISLKSNEYIKHDMANKLRAFAVNKALV